ncbi:hypothetical protein GCM10022415_07140 [Knoellia locipacati]|uniref:Uncharacterized protein n=1 Tax=Knoellia locipacati TaxID=882824 RepID=A0A512SXN3_9MICO|nr:hypothetical protein [Knoellia locipacati]GEQ12665.1 hypothetical protein KLO01_07120 [Knoellia locipacati]
MTLMRLLDLEEQPTVTVTGRQGLAEADVRPGVIPACRAVEALHAGSHDTLSRSLGANSVAATWRPRLLVR